MRKRLKPQDMLCEINITSLTDIVMTLLIVFIIAAPMIKEGKAVELPNERGDHASQLGHDSMIVCVDRDGGCFFNEKPVSPGELTAWFSNFTKANPELVVFFKADKGCYHKDTMRVMAALRNGGVRYLQILTEPTPGS